MAAAGRSAAVAALVASDSSQSLQQRQYKHSLALPLSSSQGDRLCSKYSFRPLVRGHQRTRICVSPVNEAAVDGSTNATAVATSEIEFKSEESTPVEARAPVEVKPEESASVEAPVPVEVKSEESAPVEAPELAREASVSAVMADVASLVKLVDSRDIVELEVKHFDYELVIWKKEALSQSPPPTFTPPQVVAQAPYPMYMPSPSLPAMPLTTERVPASAPAAAISSTPAQPAPAVTNLPRILSPMAGTFYRSPAPGEPPFVKVGDKVQKGQVICIVEAMKLMNEIEADQSGTIADLLIEDGKPVAIDTPLFAIKP